MSQLSQTQDLILRSAAERLRVSKDGAHGSVYFSMLIGEKSWNQFCACTKPFTLALIARGLTSWVTIRNSASSTNFSGDRILFGKYSGSEIKIDGEEYLILKEDEILGVLE